MSVWDKLLGKVITQLYVSDDQEQLLFVHPNQECTIISTDADCCSETWFADIVGVDTTLKYSAAVTKVDSLELPPIQDKRTRQEYDEFYGVKISTGNYKHLYIVYRNSSNGYYGGNACEFTGDPNKIVWTQITEDWQA